MDIRINCSKSSKVREKHVGVAQTVTASSMSSRLRFAAGQSDGSSSSTTTIGDDGLASASARASEPPDGEGVGKSASIGGGALRVGSGAVVNGPVLGGGFSFFSACAPMSLGAEPRVRFPRPRPRARPSVLIRSFRNRTMWF